MELLGDVGHVKSHFGLFGDSVGVGAIYLHVCVERAIGLEIGLDAPDVTPRLRWSCGNMFRSVWR